VTALLRWLRDKRLELFPGQGAELDQGIDDNRPPVRPGVRPSRKPTLGRPGPRISNDFNFR
jgi:hypothetical protein